MTGRRVGSGFGTGGQGDAGPAGASARGERRAADPRVATLRRMRGVALALLLAALAGLALAHWQGGRGAWGWLAAFCEASAVGAIADWFAVVALFRRPLGLPLPHTAIIPRSKARVADGLAAFVRDHFLEPEALLARLEVFDPARRLGEWMNDPARVAGRVREGRAWALKALALVDDDRMRSATLELALEHLRRWNGAATAAEVLTVLTRGGRHQELLDAALQKIGGFLAEDEVKAAVSELMVRHARKEWPKVIGMVEIVTPAGRIADGLADRLAASVLGELRDAMAQPQHPIRLRYERWLAEFIERLRTDEALIAAFDRVKARAIDDPAMREYVATLWGDVKRLLRDDLARDDSTIAAHLERGLRDAGVRLAADPALRAALNEHLLAAAGQLAGNLRGGVTGHIAQTIKAWDDRRLVAELELNVGRDLQFIRINGTVVGGLAGLALHAAQVLLR